MAYSAEKTEDGKWSVVDTTMIHHDEDMLFSTRAQRVISVFDTMTEACFAVSDLKRGFVSEAEIVYRDDPDMMDFHNA